MNEDGVVAARWQEHYTASERTALRAFNRCTYARVRQESGARAGKQRDVKLVSETTFSLAMISTQFQAET